VSRANGLDPAGIIEIRALLYRLAEVDDVSRAERILRDELGFVGLSRSGEASLRITDRTAKPAPIARALAGAGIALERLVTMEEDLERHFMRLTGGES
jgi:hypothetical protein